MFIALEINAIENADVVVVMSYGRQSTAGTNWEAGYAFGIGKKVIVIEMSDAVMSLMVANGRWATLKGLEGLANYHWETTPVERTHTKVKCGFKEEIILFTEEIMEKLPNIVAESFSRQEVLEKIGKKNSGQAARNLRELIRDGKLDTSHFSGRGWRKQTNREVKGNLKYKPEDIFVENSPVIQKVLRTYVEMYQMIPYRCCMCGNEGEWQGQQLKLQIDHINGNNRDNRIKNLRYICPNCHSQTDTFGGRNKHKNLKRRDA